MHPTRCVPGGARADRGAHQSPIAGCRRGHAACGAVISSVDVGFRKPHPAPLEAALAAAGCRAAQAVMVGNSEHNGVRPAVALGLRALLVSIEKPRLAASAAHAVADSLDDAATVLARWASAASPR